MSHPVHRHMPREKHAAILRHLSSVHARLIHVGHEQCTRLTSSSRPERSTGGIRAREPFRLRQGETSSVLDLYLGACP